ncbi:MAG: ATP-binding protein [Desulfurivibrionaceae bacterium]|nr:ATP-binding protein [Desulfurivibrionaceae bacterium]
MAIILGGFTLVLLQGARVSHSTQEKNQLINDHFLPAALQAREIQAAYRAQLKEFEEAVRIAEPQRLQAGASHGAELITNLEQLAGRTALPAELTRAAEQNLARYRLFADQALPLYSRLLNNPSDPDLRAAAEELDRLADNLDASFSRLARTTKEKVGEELRQVSTHSRQQNRINLLIFLTVIITSVLLVAYILAHSITRPLQKTVALANKMAAGDLSQQLDHPQNDEIGGLVRAMNAMARQLELHYLQLEAAVHDKSLTLQKTDQLLHQEISQRKDIQHELLHAMAETEKANRAKSSFLAMMSHELRTPMNGIIGMGSLLLDTSLNETQQRYITTICTSAETLLTIINDILDFSKIEADKMELEAVDFRPRRVMAEISDILSSQARDKGLGFFTLIDPSVPEWLQGDARRLRQILLNLADNALKFTAAGEVALRMEVIAATAKSATIRFAISDTGPGIAADRLPHLFEPFIQADISTTRKFGGTGLGLAISKRLVELMGGNIEVESSEGAGSTFWFTARFAVPAHISPPLPAPRDRTLIYSEAAAPARSAAPFSAPGTQILVAGDDKTNLVVAQAILESFGCIVHLARTGQEALERLLTTDYDLILMDVQMPILNGLEAAAIIKGWAQSAEPEKQRKSRTPIIALTADTFHGYRHKNLAAGMADTLEKPLRPEALARCLQQWLPDQQQEKNGRPDTLGFSRARLLQRLGGDEQKVSALTLAARIAIPRYLASLDSACTNNNCQQAEETCQEIKALAAKLGVAELQHHALHLGLAMAGTDRDLTWEHYAKLKSLLSELLHNLEG